MVKGLREYREKKEAEAAAAEAGRLGSRYNRFALANDGDSVIIRFAQEIDYDAANYNKGRGIGFVNAEHTNGSDTRNGWMTRTSCTMESLGACYGCERYGDYTVDWENRKAWRAKEKFYIWVIGGEVKETKVNDKTRLVTTSIDRNTGNGVPYLLEMGTYNGIYNDLADFFLEEDFSGNTITNKFFKITRRGDKFNNTAYGLTPLGPVPDDATDLSEFDLLDIEKDILKPVPYAQQAAFYGQSSGHGGNRPVSGDDVTPPVEPDATEVW